MGFLQDLAVYIRPPDPRPISQIDQEIADELAFHLEMRTLANAEAGLDAEEARRAVLAAFGDVRDIHRACRGILVGDRIMLQRVQAVLTAVLLLAVVFLAAALLHLAAQSGAGAGPDDGDARSARRELIGSARGRAGGTGGRVGGHPPVVVETSPPSGQQDVDPATSELRVTFSKPMIDGSWSWSQLGEDSFPETTGSPRYLDDQKTCVLPVKLQPRREYMIWLNSEKFGNFKGQDGRRPPPSCCASVRASSNARAASLVRSRGAREILCPLFRHKEQQQ